MVAAFISRTTGDPEKLRQIYESTYRASAGQHGRGEDWGIPLVALDGELIFSKWALARHAKPGEISALVAKRIGPALEEYVNHGPEKLDERGFPPGWLVGFVRDGMFLSAPRAEPGLRQWSATWSDMKWIRECWGGPLVIKGIVTAEDARRAVAEGASAVVVSNHGGHALDGSPATLVALPEVLAAVGGELEVLCDGGVRRGSDVVKAVALGARAVLVGRPFLWSLALGGEQGLMRMFEVFSAEIDRTLALLGDALNVIEHHIDQRLAAARLPAAA